MNGARGEGKGTSNTKTSESTSQTCRGTEPEKYRLPKG